MIKNKKVILLLLLLLILIRKSQNLSLLRTEDILNAKNGVLILTKASNPYLINENLIIHKHCKLIIEPGVELRFGKGRALIVYGILEANGKENERILMTKSGNKQSSTLLFNKFRLVDGESIQDGHLQIYRNHKWMYTCTNFFNWSQADANVTCKSLGFKNGTFYYTHETTSNYTTHMKLYQPKCKGNERTLNECEGSDAYELGRSICDGQTLINILCEGINDELNDQVDNWHGLVFERNAPFFKQQKFTSFFYNISQSVLNYVDILHAGLHGSALTIFQYSPQINSLKIENSHGNALNASNIEAPLLIENSLFQFNRGHGLFIRTRYSNVSLVNVSSCFNGGDGLKYTFNNTVWSAVEESELFDVRYKQFCHSQNPLTFPAYFKFKNPNYIRECVKTFSTDDTSLRVTLHFQMVSIANAFTMYYLELYDGQTELDPLIVNYTLKNNHLPESINSQSNYMFAKLKFKCLLPAHKQYLCANATQMDDIRMYATISNRKDVDLSISNCTFSGNSMNGLNISNVRSFIEINSTTIANNMHSSGLHVCKGAGTLSIFNCKIMDNHLNGINLTYAGGYKEINDTLIRNNHFNGIFIRYVNDTRDNLQQTLVMNSTSIEFNHENGMILEFNHGNVSINASKVASNKRHGIYIREYTQNTTYNVSWNLFEKNYLDSMHIDTAQSVNGLFTNNTFFGNVKGGFRLSSNLSLYGLASSFVNLSVTHNYFLNNSGRYAASFSLNEKSRIQMLNVTHNKFEYNQIGLPFDGVFNARLQANAVLLVDSSNVRVNYNYFNNSQSLIDLASNLENSTSIINASFNWYAQFEPKYYTSYVSSEKDFCNRYLNLVRARIFDFSNRSNLAQIYFTPYSCNFVHQTYEHSSAQFAYFQGVTFNNPNSFGGLFDVGEYELPTQSYLVTNDIIVRPRAKLTIRSGTQLNFINGVGMLVQGELVVEGTPGAPVKFKLGKQDVYNLYRNTTSRTRVNQTHSQLRLSDGTKGRLEVFINGERGTVCNRKWSLANSALVCHQLGLLVDPNRFLYTNENEPASTHTRILMSEVECDPLDDSLFDCHYTKANDHTCTIQDNVYIQCLPQAWSSLRLGITSKPSIIRYAHFEQAGQYDYNLNRLTPALQLDLGVHTISNLTFESNIHDSIDILYTNPYRKFILSSINLARNNSNGIVTRVSHVHVAHLSAHHQNYSAFEYNPLLTREQLEFVRIGIQPERSELKRELTRLLNNHLSIGNEAIFYVYTDTEAEFGPKEMNIKVDTNNDRILVVDLIDFNTNFNEEQVLFCEKICSDSSARKWNLSQSIYFPINTSSSVLHINYKTKSLKSGRLAFMIYTVRAPERVYDSKNPNSFRYKNQMPESIISIVYSLFTSNRHAIVLKHYDETEDESGNIRRRIFNQTFLISQCIFNSSANEVIVNKQGYEEYDLVPNVKHGPLSHINITLSNNILSGNLGGLQSLYRYHEYSNIIWHFEIISNKFLRNEQNGLKIVMPLLYRFAIKNDFENKTHSMRLHANEFNRNTNFELIVDGYYAQINMTRNLFIENNCKHGLIHFSGTEKDFFMYKNRLSQNEGEYMFNLNAQSHADNSYDIESLFVENILENNRPISTFPRKGAHLLTVVNSPTQYTFALRGIQNCTLNRNTFSNNAYSYEFVGALQTNSLNSTIDATLNYWATTNSTLIKERIFDVNEWNNHAFVTYVPYRLYAHDDQLSRDQPKAHAESSQYTFFMTGLVLGGLIEFNLILNRTHLPYQVRSDLTIMPGYTMRIEAGVEIEFYPNVGILVLGNIIAKGDAANLIKMRSVRIGNNRMPFYSSLNEHFDDYVAGTLDTNIRLFNGLNSNQGFLQVYNNSLKAWTMVCDRQLTLQTARVVCKQLRKPFLNTLVHQIYHYVPIEYKMPIWNQTFLCTGDEFKLEECNRFANYRMSECVKQGEYVYVECGEFNMDFNYEPWGGIRFANAHFETSSSKTYLEQSHLKYVEIFGAGRLHNDVSPALQLVYRTPIIEFVNIFNSTYHGIEIVQPMSSVSLNNLNIKSNLGYALNSLLLNVQTSHLTSSYGLIKTNTLSSSSVYSLINVCDPHKEYQLNQRVLIYYKYSSLAKDCVKIFSTKSNAGYLALRFMQVNLLNSTIQNDTIEIYNGTLFNRKFLVASLTNASSHAQFKHFYVTKTNTLSVYLRASIGREYFGFIAEVLLHPTAMYLSPETYFEVSDSHFESNQLGSAQFVSAGERNPNLYLIRNRFVSNGKEIFNTSTHASIDIYLQNTPKFIFGNNLISKNYGSFSLQLYSGSGVLITRSSIFNNYFYSNKNSTILSVNGEILLPYNEVFVYRNFFIENNTPKTDVIHLAAIVSQFSSNQIQRNNGTRILSIYGFENVSSPRNQEISYNLLTDNYAYGLVNNYEDLARFRTSILASSSKQTYFNNYLFNKDNDFEFTSLSDPYAKTDLSSIINASYNYWATRIESELKARIRDKYDHETLHEVMYYPAIYDEQQLRNGKCDLGWTLIDDICFIYVGYYAKYKEAEQTCKVLGGKLARETVAPSKSPRLRQLARDSQVSYETQTYRKMWLHTDNAQSGSCIIMDDYETTQILYADCAQELNTFICEKYPIFVGAKFRFKDEIALAIGSLSFLALVLILLFLLSLHKSRVKKKENFDRQDTLRRSARNNKHLFATSTTNSLSKSTNTLTKNEQQRSSNRYVKNITTQDDEQRASITDFYNNNNNNDNNRNDRRQSKRILTNRFRPKSSHSNTYHTYDSQIDETLSSDMYNKNDDSSPTTEESLKTLDTYYGADQAQTQSSPKRTLKKSNTHTMSIQESHNSQISSFSPIQKDTQSQSSNYENITYPFGAQSNSFKNDLKLTPPSIPPPSIPRKSLLILCENSDSKDTDKVSFDDNYETIKSTISINVKKLQILSDIKKSPLLNAKQQKHQHEQINDINDFTKPPPMETAI